MRIEAEPNFVEHMSWREVERRIEAGAAAILPVGAAAKQHGLHLPLDTDPKFELRLEGYKKTRKRIKWRGKTSVTAEVTLKPLAGGAADAPPAASGAAPTPAPESDSDSN